MYTLWRCQRCRQQTDGLTFQAETLPEFVESANAPLSGHVHGHNLNRAHDARRVAGTKRACRMRSGIHKDPGDVAIVEHAILATLQTCKRPRLDVLFRSFLEALCDLSFIVSGYKVYRSLTHLAEIFDRDILCRLAGKARCKDALEPSNVWLGKSGVPTIQKIKLDAVRVTAPTE